MKVHGHIDLLDNEIQRAVMQTEPGFPDVPKVGRLCFTNKRVYICVDIAGSPIWIPLTNEVTMYVHTQEALSTTWNIVHNLKTTTPLVQIYDVNYKVIIPDEITVIDNNTISVTFGANGIGKAVVMYGDITGGDKQEISYAYTHTQTTTSTTWIIPHGLGYTPIVRVFVGSEEIQPSKIVHDTVFQTTITFTTNQVGVARLI